MAVMEIVENFQFIRGNIIFHEMALWVLILVRVNANRGAQEEGKVHNKMTLNEFEA